MILADQASAATRARLTADATLDTLQALRRGDLAGIRELRLPGGLTAFPPEIFGLADTLEVLDLGDGHLTALPDDMGRLGKLRVLFCSNNRFERLPPSLGDCVSLSQLGFRGTGMREVPGEALPPALRWLTLTDNRIEHLPDALGERPLLQKLMLSGNRLRQLPAVWPGPRTSNWCGSPPTGSTICRPGSSTCLGWPGSPGPATPSSAVGALRRCPRSVGASRTRRTARRRRIGPGASRALAQAGRRASAGRGEAVQRRHDQRRPSRTRDGGLSRGRRPSASHGRARPADRPSRAPARPPDAASAGALAGARGAAEPRELQPRRLRSRLAPRSRGGVAHRNRRGRGRRPPPCTRDPAWRPLRPQHPVRSRHGRRGAQRLRRRLRAADDPRDAKPCKGSRCGPGGCCSANCSSAARESLRGWPAFARCRAPA